MAYENQNIASIDSVGFPGRRSSARAASGSISSGTASNLTVPRPEVSRLDRGRRHAAETPIPVAPTLFGNARASPTRSVGPAALTLAARGTALPGGARSQNAFDGNFPVPRCAAVTRKAQATFERTVCPRCGSGHLVPRHRQLRRAARTLAYVAGPVLQATPAQPLREQVPNQRMQIWIGVDYVF